MQGIPDFVGDIALCLYFLVAQAGLDFNCQLASVIKLFFLL